MNDTQRQEWVDNDEWLYDLQRRSGLAPRAWIRENRAMIDAYAGNITSGAKRPHYGKYE